MRCRNSADRKRVRQTEIVKDSKIQDSNIY